MPWNWQQPDWPNFTWDAPRLAGAEQRFLQRGGVVLGAEMHLSSLERETILVDSLSEEALTTSAIEGEILDRPSVQSSIRQHLGLPRRAPKPRPSEDGIGQVTVEVYRHYSQPLSRRALAAWHATMLGSRRDLRDIGRYRTHKEAMQVVSTAMTYRVKVHFEAPPSDRVPGEMKRFIEWFNATRHTLPAITRAGIAHLYFESVHPFEDGNGRLGRAVSEKALAQGHHAPTITGLAAAILARRRSYYEALQKANKSNDVSNWLAWFAGITLEAQHRSLARVEFVLDKTRLLDRLRGSLNPRQDKVVHRMLREGPAGFVGGLSAAKYAAITKASSASVTRDLAELVDINALRREGEKRFARYSLTIPIRPTPRIVVGRRGEIIESPAE